ncbi:MAG: hypothetical protein IKP88_18425 [Lachnospiraceae bacterium]|nr:hypothetical protein [Lachnospiraceae bacterium]
MGNRKNVISDEVRRNKAAILCYIITISVITFAYLLEVIKGNRALSYFITVFVSLWIPGAIVLVIHFTRKYIDIVKYIILLGFALPWGFMLFTANNDLVFTYALVIMIALNAYADKKFAITTAITYNVINIASVAFEALLYGMSSEKVVTSEIQILLLLLCGIFNIFVANTGVIINREKLESIKQEKNHAATLLDTVLAVSNELSGGISQMNVKMKELHEAMERTCYAMEEVSTGTGLTSDSVQTQIVMTEEIQGRLDDVAAHANAISQSVSETGKAIAIGSDNMDSLEKEVETSDKFSLEATKELSELKNSTKQMQGIVELINNVADQTSLLALNASIEAARAGEAGRGFSVVASEISNLANQTQSATGDINELISGIEKKLLDVDKVINAFIESSRRQHDATMVTVKNLDIIKSDSHDIERNADGLSKAVDRLAEANKTIIDAVQNISAIMEEVSAHAKETYESSLRNSTTVDEMMVIVGHLNEQAVSMKQD